MLNHIHLIVTAHNVSGFVRDFKKYTSKRLKENIRATEPRIQRLFLDCNDNYCFWQKTNSPKLIETDIFFQQKLDYIHNNPVLKSYVLNPEDWYWSSANPYCELKADKSNW